jgi:hypothetical protein
MIDAGLVLAGPPPAAVKLAFILSIRIQLHSHSPRPIHCRLIRTKLIIPTRPHNHLCISQSLTSSASLRSPNPHSRLPHRSPAGLPAHYLLARFRALALFGRRPPERVAGSSLPAAENLHTTGREQSQQMALYSITSSAIADSVGGTSTPSALAAFKLITNSNLVNCTTGRSAGLSPLRIRPA